MSSEPKHERGDLLALALEVFLRCLTGAREISNSFMPLIGHPDRGQFPARDNLAKPKGAFHYFAVREATHGPKRQCAAPQRYSRFLRSCGHARGGADSTQMTLSRHEPKCRVARGRATTHGPSLTRIERI